MNKTITALLGTLALASSTDARIIANMRYHDANYNFPRDDRIDQNIITRQVDYEELKRLNQRLSIDLKATEGDKIKSVSVESLDWDVLRLKNNLTLENPATSTYIGSSGELNKREIERWKDYKGTPNAGVKLHIEYDNKQGVRKALEYRLNVPIRLPKNYNNQRR